MRAGGARAFKQKSVERDARVNGERLVEFQMQMLSRRRVHIEFVDRAADCIKQMRPGFQSLRRHPAAAGLRFAGRTPIEQRHAHAATREAFSGERTGRAGADNQDIEAIHVSGMIVGSYGRRQETAGSHKMDTDSHR